MTHLRVTWPIHMWDMTHLYVRHDSSICDARLDSFIRTTWLIHTRDMTHSYVWRDVWRDSWTWHTHTCDVTHPNTDSSTNEKSRPLPHSRVRRDSSIRVTWLVHTWDMSRSYVWYHSFITRFVNGTAEWTHPAFMRETWLVNTCDMTIHMWKWLMHTCDVIHPNPDISTEE